LITKGIILSGGSGSRLRPLTFSTNKQLLPIYDKPMIYYPLSVLMLANIKDILIITNPNDILSYKKLLGNGKDLGIKISFMVQKKPSGLPEAFILGEKFINNKNVALILGDNFFYGSGFSEKLNNLKKFKSGAKIYLYNVSKPELYGVAKIKNKKIIKLVEKPKKFISDLAVTGFYLFDKNVSTLAKKLTKSKRGEFEITDLIKKYIIKKKIKYEILGRGFTWLDSGNPEDLFRTSEYVSTIENRQGIKIGCIEEIAYNKKWVTKKELEIKIKSYGPCHYSDYLKKVILSK
jgi:glucose-1-phosphate thymidylyltransferase